MPNLTSGSAIIDFCIGMMFFFLIMTLTCTMINEYLMDKFAKMRQKTLLEGIAGLFYDRQILEEFYKHPLIMGLYDDDPKKGLWQRLREFLGLGKRRSTSTSQGVATSKPTIKDCVQHLTEQLKKDFKTVRKLPAYIPSRTFANALLDIAFKKANLEHPPGNLPELRNAVDQIGIERIKGALLPLIDAAPDLETARQNIEKWFDDTMDRVSGWFKRRARTWLLAVAAIVCLVLNADTIMVGKMLWQNDALRATVVKQAESYIDKESKKPEAGASAPPASKPTAPPISPKKNRPKSSGAEKAMITPSSPATPETVKPKTETGETKEKEKKIGQKVQDEINKLQFPLGWVCPEQDKFEKMECGWLKSILSCFCEDPTKGQRTPVTPAIKEAPTGPGTTKDQGKKDQQQKKDNDTAKIYDPRTVPTKSGDIFLKIMGLFFTTLAISFGAPFWTDLLNMFVNLRKTGKVPAKSGEEKK